MRPRRSSLALVTVSVMALTSCSLGMRTPAHAHPFCDPALGRLVLPGQILDTAIVRNRRGEMMGRIPVYTNDSVCVRRRPLPYEVPYRLDTLESLTMRRVDDRPTESRHS